MKTNQNEWQETLYDIHVTTMAMAHKQYGSVYIPIKQLPNDEDWIFAAITENGRTRIAVF